MVFDKDIRNGYIQYGQTLTALSKITGDVTTKSELLALTVQNLTPRQQALALATKGVNQAQIAEVLALNQVEEKQIQQVLLDTAIIQKKKELTMATAQEAITAQGLNKATAISIMKSAGIVAADEAQVISKKKVNVAILQTKLAQEGLSAVQIKAITTQLGLSNSALTLSNHFKGLAKSILSSAKSFGAFLISSPMGWMTIAMGVVTIITAIINKQKEAQQAIKDTADETKALTNNINSLYQTYTEMKLGVDNNTNSKEELSTATYDLLEALGYEGKAVDDLIAKYGNLETAIDNAIISKLKEAHGDLISSVAEYRKDLLEEGDSWSAFKWGNANTFHFKVDDEEFKKIKDILDKTNGLTSTLNVGHNGRSGSYNYNLNGDTSTVEGIAQNYETLLKLRDSLIDNFGAKKAGELDIYEDITNRLNELKTAYENYSNEVSSLNQNAAKISVTESLIGKELPKTIQEYKKYRTELIQSATASGLFEGSQKDIVYAIDTILSKTKGIEDFQKQIQNLESAKNKFMGSLTPNSAYTAQISAFLESLSPEDLEIAIQIPDLFIDGIENATEKIENFNKVNNFDKSIKSLEELKEAYDGISDSADKFISNQKIVNSAFEEQEKYGQLASSTVSSLIEAGYSRALSVNAETGAITLNKDAVEMLNNVKKQELKLSIMREKLSLQEKLRDESVEINSLTAEMAHATEERREEIRTLIAERMAQAALNDEAIDLIKQYDAILGMIENPIEFDDSKKSTKDEESTQITNFKKTLAEKQHLVAMKKLSEEEYLNWLDGAYKTAYAGLEGYDDDLYKYEEEIFSKRKELAEKAFDDTIDGIEKEIDVLEKLKDEASLDINAEGSIYSIIDQQILLYQQAIDEIGKRIAELEASGLVGIEDEIEELNKQKDDLLEKVYDLGKERTSTGIENEISYWEEMQSKQNEFYDKQIEKLKKQKELLEDKNDEEERAKDLAEKQLELRKAQIALEDARRNRNVLVYTAGGGYSYETDKTAIAEAEEDVKKAQEDLAELRQEEIKDNLDKQIDILEEQKDNDDEYYDTIIKLLEDMSGKNKVQSESNRSIWSELLATEGGQNALANIDPDKLQELLDSGFLVQKDGKYSLGEKKPSGIIHSETDIIKLLGTLLHKSESEILANTQLMNAAKNGFSNLNSVNTMPNQNLLSELTKVNTSNITNYNNNNNKVSNTYHVDKIDVGYSGDDFNGLLKQAFNALNQSIIVNGHKIVYGS